MKEFLPSPLDPYSRAGSTYHDCLRCAWNLGSMAYVLMKGLGRKFVPPRRDWERFSFETALLDIYVPCQVQLIQDFPAVESRLRVSLCWHENTRERGSTMFNSGSLVRSGRMPVLVLVLVAAVLSGCSSKQVNG
jgi:hypothetical protein